MSKTRYVVKAMWDEEARVWVAESDDVPGLVTEAATQQELIRKLEIVVPELLEANDLLGRRTTIPFRMESIYDRTLKVHSTEVIHTGIEKAYVKAKAIMSFGIARFRIIIFPWMAR